MRVAGVDVMAGLRAGRFDGPTLGGVYPTNSLGKCPPPGDETLLTDLLLALERSRYPRLRWLGVDEGAKGRLAG